MSIDTLAQRVAQQLLLDTPVSALVTDYHAVQDAMDDAVLDRQRYHPAYYIDAALGTAPHARERLLQLIREATSDWKITLSDLQTVIDITATSIRLLREEEDYKREVRAIISDSINTITTGNTIDMRVCGNHRRSSTYSTRGTLRYRDNTTTARLGSYLSSVCSADVPMIALLPSRYRQNELTTEHVKLHELTPASVFAKYDVLSVSNTPKMICLVSDGDDYTVVTMTMNSDQLSAVEQVTITFTMHSGTQYRDILHKLSTAIPALTVDHKQGNSCESNIAGLTRVLLSQHVPLTVMSQVLSGIRWEDNIIHSLFTSRMTNSGILAASFLVSTRRDDFKFVMNSYRLNNGGVVVLADGTSITCPPGQRYFTVHYNNLADYQTLELMLQCMRYVVLYAWQRGIVSTMLQGQSQAISWLRNITIAQAEQHLVTMHDYNVDENSVDDGFVRSYMGPDDQVKSINAYNRTMHPDVFLAGKHSRSTQANREPIVVDYDTAVKWKARYGVEPMEFPWPGHPQRAGGKPPQFYVVCRPDGDRLTYPGIKENRRSNKNVYPYVPVCRTTDQMAPYSNSLYQRVYLGNDTTSTQVHRNSKEVLPDKIAKPEGLGMLPKQLRGIINWLCEDSALRLGVYALPHSMLHSIMAIGRRFPAAAQYMSQYHQHYPRVHEIMVTHYQQQSQYLQNSQYRVTIVRQLVEALADVLRVMPWIVRQEQYDMAPEVVAQALLDTDNMTPEWYHQLITMVFGINVYVFDHRHPTELVIPRHQLYHARTPRHQLMTLVLIRHTGSEADDLEFPHYEAIICKNSTTGLMTNSQRWHELLCDHHEYIAWRPGVGGVSNSGNMIDLNALTAAYRGLKQHFDSYGKLRAITLDDKVTIFVPPTAPLLHRWATQGTDADIRHIPMAAINTGTFKLFAEPYTLSPDGETVYWSVTGLDNVIYAHTTKLDDDELLENNSFTNIDALQAKLSVMVQLLTWMQRTFHSVYKRFLTQQEFDTLCSPPESLTEDDYDVSGVPMVLPSLPPNQHPIQHTMGFIAAHTKRWVVDGKFRSYCQEWRDVLNHLNEIIVRSDSTYIPPFIIKNSDVAMRQMSDTNVVSFSRIEDYLNWLGESTTSTINAVQARTSIDRNDTILTVTSQPYIMEYSHRPVGQIMIQNVRHGWLLNAMYVSSKWMSTGVNIGYDQTPDNAWLQGIMEQHANGTLVNRLTVYALDNRNVVRLIHNRDCPRAQRMVLLCYNQSAVESIQAWLATPSRSTDGMMDYAAALILTP